jgi:hypothetical protein
VNNGKIKGLFVCLPQEQFYSFSVFGLHAQVVPYKPTINLQQLSGEIFSTAWFHAEPPAGKNFQLCRYWMHSLKYHRTCVVLLRKQLGPALVTVFYAF